MTTTLYTVAPVTKFSAAGYDIVQAGTVVPDGAVPSIQSAAFGANVTINTSAGGAPQLVQVPSYYNGGTGAPVGDSLPVGAEVRDSTGASWEKKSDGTWAAVSGGSGGAVSSVAGKTGAVSLVKADVGLGNVDNTADTAKPVSTAQQAALDAKAPLLRAVSVAYAATITPNADTTDVLNVGSLTGNLTVANPTGTPRDGQMLRLRMAQDATGGRTITFGNAFAFGTDVTQALIPTTASAKYVLLFSWDATSSTWRALAIARGF